MVTGPAVCCHLAHVRFIGPASRLVTLFPSGGSGCVKILCGLFAGLARSAASFWGGRAGACTRRCRKYAIHSSLPQGMRNLIVPNSSSCTRWLCSLFLLQAVALICCLSGTQLIADTICRFFSHMFPPYIVNGKWKTKKCSPCAHDT